MTTYNLQNLKLSYLNQLHWIIVTKIEYFELGWRGKQAFHAFDEVVSFPTCLCVYNNHHLKHSSWYTHNKTCWNLFCIDKMTNIKVFLVLFRSPRSTIKLKRLPRGMGLQRHSNLTTLVFNPHKVLVLHNLTQH
jgi:hypothetical protein